MMVICFLQTRLLACFSLNTPMRIHRILHALLQQVMPKEKRFAIMKHAIMNATKSIYIIVHELREQEREHTENEDTYVPLEFRDFTSEQLDELKAACVEQIKKWAKHGYLVSYPYLLSGALRLARVGRVRRNVRPL